MQEGDAPLPVEARGRATGKFLEVVAVREQ